MPKPLNEQVVVITGASSGIGRETAIQFGKRGASVILAARNQQALAETAAAVEEAGGRADIVLTDVAEWEQVNHLAQEAIHHFGRIDTWVNNASIAEYATVEETTIEEMERIIQVNLLGVIYGVKAALPHLKRQGGGTIINVASVVARRGIPLLAAYSAAKHGVKGFTEALRQELLHEHSPVHVTLILPSSINTPFFNHARSKLGVLPRPIPPVYEPQVVAEAILFAAEHPRRAIVAGGGGKLLELFQRIHPRLVDWYLLQNGRIFKQQMADRLDNGRDNLFSPMHGSGSVSGEFGEEAKSVSLYTRHLELHPGRKAGLLAMLAAGLVGLLARRG